MSHLVLYRKYRPRKFSEITGQAHVVKTITNQIKFGEVAHGYLFSGPRGVGKTTIARLIAKSLNCEKRKKDPEPCTTCASCVELQEGRSLDLIEIDAASNRGIDEIRELRDKIRFTPTKGNYKVYIIDEVHMLTKEAFNALLKTLEEPPAHALFILATTEISKIPPTIISRTQRFDFKHLSIDEITHQLKTIAQQEKIEIDAKALHIIALNAEGGMRDAASLLGQVMSVEDKKITTEEVELILGKSSQESIVGLVDYITEKKLRESLVLVNTLLEDGFDLSRFTKELIDYLRKLLLAKVGGEDKALDLLLRNTLNSDQVKKLHEQSTKLATSFIVRAIMLFSDSETHSAVFPQLGLELALVELLVDDANASVQGSANHTPNSPSDFSQGKHATSDSSLVPKEHPRIETPKSQSDTDTSIHSYANAPKEEILVVKDKDTAVRELAEDSVHATSDEKEADMGDIVESVKNSWQEIIQQVKIKNYTAAAFLRQCVPLGYKDKNLYIVTQFGFHKDKLNEAKMRYAIEDVFMNVLQKKVGLRFVDGEQAKDLGYEISLEDKNDKAVHDAIEILGGEVIE